MSLCVPNGPLLVVLGVTEVIRCIWTLPFLVPKSSTQYTMTVKGLTRSSPRPFVDDSPSDTDMEEVERKEENPTSS